LSNKIIDINLNKHMDTAVNGMEKGKKRLTDEVDR
jgi:hypothetical protein